MLWSAGGSEAAPALRRVKAELCTPLLPAQTPRLCQSPGPDLTPSAPVSLPEAARLRDGTVLPTLSPLCRPQRSPSQGLGPGPGGGGDRDLSLLS